MLSIIVPGREFYDEESELFVTVGETQLELEHSLVSLSKWESRWEKPFIGNAEKTTEQVTSYIQFMCLTPDVPPEVFDRVSNENLQEINDYLNSKMTATWFSADETATKGPQEVITSEVVYYWMITMNVPMECQHWHLERLFTLLKVIQLKSAPPKKRNRADVAAQRRALNQKRQQEFGTKG